MSTYFLAEANASKGINISAGLAIKLELRKTHMRIKEPTKLKEHCTLIALPKHISSVAIHRL